MSIYNNLVFNTNMPLKDTIGGARITLVDFSGVLIEGHKGVFRYSPQLIIIQLKDERLEISGDKMLIEQINIDEIYIKGKINNITRQTG